MRKIAYLAVFLLIVAVVFIVLAATNYAGIGTGTADLVWGGMLRPIRDFFVNGWLFIGTSGWYILAAVVAIGIGWIPFYAVVIKGLFWNKLVQEKILHHTPSQAPAYQSAPSATIPITGLQSAPAQSSPSPQTPQAAPEEKKEAA